MTKKSIALIGAILFAGLLTACGVADADTPPSTTQETTTSTEAPTTTAAPTTTSTTEAPTTTAAPTTTTTIELTNQDFVVELVVLEEQCFNTAGSLITAEPELTTSIVGQGQITITYQVEVEGGTDTYSIDYDSDTGKYSFSELDLSTETCNPSLTATVTRVRAS